MLSIAILDAKRILRSKGTWGLLLLALTVATLKIVQSTIDVGLGVDVSNLDTSGFLSFLQSNPPPFDGLHIEAQQASPLLRLMLSFQFLDNLALAAIVVFGGFFAHDISNNYVSLRQCRGVSPRRYFAANIITIAMVSLVFTTVGIAFLYAVCLAMNPQGVNSLTNGLQVLQYVSFLPQEAAAYPIAYVAAFAVLYAAVLSFLGMLGYVAAKISGRVLVASVAPAVLVLILGRLAPALPWPFVVFTYDNLSFVKRGIVDLDVAIKYAGIYPIWFGMLCVLGFLIPKITTTFRKVRIWLIH